MWLTEETRYFGAFSDDVLQKFYKSYDDWELKFVKDGLASAGISGNSRNNLSAFRTVQPGVIYHAVSNLHVLRDPDILALIRSRPSVASWPTDVPPPGLFILMFDESQDVRQWSRSFATACSEIPMAECHFVTGHELALRTVFSLIAKTTNQHNLVALHTPLVEADIGFSFPSTLDPSEIWVGFCQVLRQIPTEVILRLYDGVNCRRVVTGHLHHVGPRMHIELPCKQSASDWFSFIRVRADTKVHAFSP